MDPESFTDIFLTFLMDLVERAEECSCDLRVMADSDDQIQQEHKQTCDID